MVLSTAAIFTFSHFFNTPKSYILKQANEDLLVKYSLLMARLSSTNRSLNELMERDNKVYRSIFEVDVIPVSVRNAGMGGVARYEPLLSIPNTVPVAQALIMMDRITKKAYIQSKSLDEIAGYAVQKEMMMECIPSIQPLNMSDPKVRISAAFGWRTDPIYRVLQMHDGIDLASPAGTPIHVTGNGVVEEAKFNIHGYGNTVLVDHGFGYKTRYAHLDKIIAQKGNLIKRGEVIGTVGNTGKSTGPHLHYEVRYKSSATNPINFFSDDITAEEFDKIIKALANVNSVYGTDYQ
ncbi:MAG: M23 family metallopeptidase [Prevotellaceae bacterium]|nr:M23 family metallopeptidase [Prevotellaceae bacterium]